MRDVGLDGHQESIAVADVAQDQGAEVVSLGTTGPRQGALDTRIRPRHAKANPLVYGEEAGPCGAWLSRELTKPGPECWVVAPSCSPQQAGDRVTTDRREARQLARLVRAGDLTPVDVPQVAAEALRDRRRAATPFACARTCARRARPMGAPRISDDSRKSSVRLQRSRSSSKSTCGLSPSTPNASSACNRNSRSGSKPGA